MKAVSAAIDLLARAQDIEANARSLSGGMAGDLMLTELDLRYDPAASTVTELRTGHVWPTR